MRRTDELVPVGGWLGPERPRIEPASDRIQGVIDRVTERLGHVEPANVFSTLRRNPRLFWPWMLFASRLMPFGRIDAKDRERMILRIAWNCRSRYEWGQHVGIAERIGLPREELAWIAEGATHPRWDAHRRALLRACDELHTARCVSEEVYGELAGLYDAPTLVELLMLIGHYEMLAGVLNTLGVALEPSLEAKMPTR